MKYDDLIPQVNAILTQYTFQLTLRQVYYRLVVAGLIANQRSAYKGLSAQLVKARENGDVAGNALVDRSRRVDDNAFDSPESFLNAVKRMVDQNFMTRHWKTQAAHVEIWVEKDALSSVIGQAVEDLNVIVAPSRGYSSFSYVRDAMIRFQRLTRAGRQNVHVLHFADHDPSGLDMTRDLRTRFNAYARGFLFNVTVTRIALDIDQVRARNLIPNPAKIQDPRAAGYISQFGDDCWELDAIEPAELVDIVQEAVNAEITDPDAWEEAKATDAKYRERLTDALDELTDSFDAEGGEED